MSEFEEELLKAADEILVLIRQESLSNHFIFGTGRPVPLRVTDRTGRLVQSVIRATTRGDRASVALTPSGMEIMGRIDRGEYPHATLIHEGGQRQVTTAMRRFFWYKWHQTRTLTGAGSVENEMWSRLRFSNIISYAPRPFLINAVMDIASKIPEVLKKHALQGLQFEIQKIITGAKGKTVVG